MFVSACNVVTLKGGITLPIEVIRLAWALEDRGLRLAVEASDILVSGSGGPLTDDDRAAIRQWKPELRTLIEYDADSMRAQ